MLRTYEPVIGLEVHVSFAPKANYFAVVSTAFGALPNQNTCPVCLAYPGVLPVLNHNAIDYAIRFALAVGGQDCAAKHVFRESSIFTLTYLRVIRFRNMISLIVLVAKLNYPMSVVFVLTRAHLEEDAGKNVHGDESSYVDSKRAGVPLIEIVSEPEIKSPKKLRSI